jgi:hypothetical protein
VSYWDDGGEDNYLRFNPHDDDDQDRAADYEGDREDIEYEDGVDYDGSRLEFADPGGNSALRAASPSNPRNLPCPNCGAADRLTPADKARGYQCDSCADRAEQGFDGY